MRTALRPGGSIRQQRDRLNARGWYLPPLLSDGALSASSDRPEFAATSGGGAGTPGSWVEVVAATSADVGALRIAPTQNTVTSGANTASIIEVGVGAAGSEIVVISGLAFGALNITTGEHHGWTFPLFIPKGSRVAVRATSFVASKVLNGRIVLFRHDGGPRPSTKTITMGLSTGYTGTTLAAAGAINTKGPWTEIIAVTAEPFAALGASISSNQDTNMAGGSLLVDIGVGASGSEQVLVPDLAFATGANEHLTPAGARLVNPCEVPAGARLVARYATTSLSNTVDAVLHGVRLA